MPSSRFEKLALEKREQLFEVAAQEFAGRGFEQASLQKAVTSKGDVSVIQTS